jgi:hypothetical protein
MWTLRLPSVLSLGRSATWGIFANSLSCLQMKYWHVVGFSLHHTLAASDSMRISLFAIAALSLLANPRTAAAQLVMADISIQDGPVAGRIIVGHPGYGHPRYEYSPMYHSVPVYRMHRPRQWFRHHGFRMAHVWYDGDRDRYYDNVQGPRGHLHEVVVYQQAGRYYREGWRDDDRRGQHRDWRDEDDRD